MPTTVNDIQGRAAVLVMAAGSSEAEVRELAARTSTEGQSGYKDLDPDDQKQIDAMLPLVMQTPEQVKAGILAKAQLDRLYYNALYAAGFDAAQALTIVAHQGVGFLIGE